MMALLLVNTAEYLGDLLFSYDMCFLGRLIAPVLYLAI